MASLASSIPSSAIATCALCHGQAAEAQTVRIRTGELAGTRVNLGSNKIAYNYHNFTAHEYLVCENCRRKRRRQITGTVVGLVALFLILLVAVPLVVALVSGPAQAMSSLVVAPVATLVLASVAGIVLFGSSPENRLKVIAIKERMQAEGVRLNKFRAFSEQEYNRS